MLSFLYKGKEYSWEEWITENNEFIKKLELPNELLIHQGIRDHAISSDVNYSVAIDIFIELYYLIYSTRYALINAFQKFYDRNIVLWDKNYTGQLWLRVEYVKNSIIWYNSCEDYILQAIWIGYNLDDTSIDSKENYQKKLKNCNYNNVFNKLGNKNTTNSNALIDILKVYREDPDISYLRDTLANNLKHRANLEFEGLYSQRTIEYNKFLLKGRTPTFRTEWITPILVDIDETIEKLLNVHKKLVNHAKSIINFMDFNNMYDKEAQNGSIIFNFNSPRRPEQYKKI